MMTIDHFIQSDTPSRPFQICCL